MKRILSAVLLLFMLFSLAGCNQPEIPETQPPAPSETQPTTAPNQFNTEPVYENMYSASMPITLETYTNDDGAQIFSYSYPYLHLIIPDRDVAEKISLDFISRIAQATTEANALLDDAKLADSPAGYSYQIQYNTMRIDQGVFSMFGRIVQASDALHAGYECISASYDMTTGDVLTLGSILYHAEAKKPLSELVVATLEANEALSLYDDFRNTVLQRFSGDESIDEDFYFTANGLCFYFSPYEIAPYSAGTIIAEIPYNQLTGLIGDAYFPAERTRTDGTILVQDFDSADLDSFEQFADIIADPDATKLLLTTQSIVQDICIQKVETDAYGRVTQSCTVFAANVLNQCDAILFEADFQAQNISYLLSYTKNGQKTTHTFCQEEATGQIILSE